MHGHVNASDVDVLEPGTRTKSHPKTVFRV